MTDQEREACPLWCVNIHGPDDVIVVAGYIEAVQLANAFNAWWQDHRERVPLRPFDPRMWAVPIKWPHEAAAHAAAIASQSDEYVWLRSRLSPASPPPVPGEVGDLVERLNNEALSADDNAASGCNVEYVEPMKSWDSIAALCREAAAPLARLQAELDAADKSDVSARDLLNDVEAKLETAELTVQENYGRAIEAIARAEAAESELASLREQLNRAREALRPFAAFYKKRHAAYVKRGGSFAAFPDTHPSFDIFADKQELPLGVWRRAAALAEPEGDAS